MNTGPRQAANLSERLSRQQVGTSVPRLSERNLQLPTPFMLFFLWHWFLYTWFAGPPLSCSPFLGFDHYHCYYPLPFWAPKYQRVSYLLHRGPSRGNGEIPRDSSSWSEQRRVFGFLLPSCKSINCVNSGLEAPLLVPSEDWKQGCCSACASAWYHPPTSRSDSWMLHSLLGSPSQDRNLLKKLIQLGTLAPTTPNSAFAPWGTIHILEFPTTGGLGSSFSPQGLCLLVGICHRRDMASPSAFWSQPGMWAPSLLQYQPVPCHYWYRGATSRPSTCPARLATGPGAPWGLHQFMNCHSSPLHPSLANCSHEGCWLPPCRKPFGRRHQLPLLQHTSAREPIASGRL